MEYETFKAILEKIDDEKPTLQEMVDYLMDNNILMTPFQLISIQQKLAKYDADIKRIFGLKKEDAVL